MPRHELSDGTLMLQYAAGDLDAFDEIFRRYESLAYAYFLRRTHSRQRAEDLYQELFLRIHRARDDYDPARPFTPWFFRIANRLLIDDHRRAFRSHEVPIEDRQAVAEGSSIDQRLAEREQIGRLLSALTPEECYVVLSAKVDGTGYREVARHVGKSVGAVKKIASRAIERVRPFLAEPSK